ncbi:UNVERIFIED_CONTAM: hypothetical protein K2H54_054594 [Gekko kuhli]
MCKKLDGLVCYYYVECGAQKYPSFPLFPRLDHGWIQHSGLAYLVELPLLAASAWRAATAGEVNGAGETSDGSGAARTWTAWMAGWSGGLLETIKLPAVTDLGLLVVMSEGAFFFRWGPQAVSWCGCEQWWVCLSVGGRDGERSQMTTVVDCQVPRAGQEEWSGDCWQAVVPGSQVCGTMRESAEDLENEESGVPLVVGLQKISQQGGRRFYPASPDSHGSSYQD